MLGRKKSDMFKSDSVIKFSAVTALSLLFVGGAYFGVQAVEDQNIANASLSSANLVISQIDTRNYTSFPSVSQPELTASYLQSKSKNNSVAKKRTSLQQSPIVIELYQSQGCSSCPPANLALNTMANNPDVIALNFSVTYWDRLGWKDIFGDPKYTDRQVAYARTLRERNVYTPQVVINGTRAIVGNRPGELKNAVSRSRKIYGGPSIKAQDSFVSISKANNKQYNTKIWLVRYDPRTLNVAIKTGENGGRTLPHKNIVRELKDMGFWTGKETNIKVPKAKDKRWKSVILVQNMGNGKILSAAKI